VTDEKPVFGFQFSVFGKNYYQPIGRQTAAPPAFCLCRYIEEARAGVPLANKPGVWCVKRTLRKTVKISVGRASVPAITMDGQGRPPHQDAAQQKLF